MKFFEPELVQSYQALFNEYLYYYYYREQAVENILNAKLTRGQLIEQVNHQMIRDFSEHPERSFEERLKVFEHYYGIREDAYMASETGKKREKAFHFDLSAPDTGGYAGVALNFIRMRQQGYTGRMILSVPNQGSLPFLEQNDVAELSCIVDSNGVHPDPPTNFHPVACELIRRMKLYERWAAEAICSRNFDLSVRALQIHPLIESYSLAKSLAKSFFKLNEPWIK